jgi:hypothetical protein
VRHLSDGTLRRIYDEPLALTSLDQAHFDGCTECKARFESIANGARATATLLSVPGFTPESNAALRSVHVRIRAEETASPPGWYERWLARTSPRWRPIATPAIAVLLAAALLTGVTATGVALGWSRVFAPTTVAPVQVGPSDFAATGALLDYGDVKWLPDAPTLHQLTDAVAAAAQSGLPVLLPASLPQGVSGPVSFGTISHATGSLTFDAERLRASAATKGVHASAMPAKINGSKLVVNAGPALLEVWGLSAGSSGAQVPTLVIAQTRVPTVDSTGASAPELEAYLLSQPGVPPDIAAQIRAIQDPSSTLPIPIPKGLATTEPVKVNGISGVMIKTVFGAGVVWVNSTNGVIYAVGGQLTPDQVLAIATTLH